MAAKLEKIGISCVDKRLLGVRVYFLSEIGIKFTKQQRTRFEEKMLEVLKREEPLRWYLQGRMMLSAELEGRTRLRVGPTAHLKYKVRY